MEIIKRESKDYGFTLKRTTSPKEATVDLYMDQIGKLFTDKGCTVSNTVFEQESGLHCHGVVNIPSKFNFKKFRIRGWHLKLEELYDAQGWYMYCNKAQDYALPDMVDTPIDNEDIMPKKKLFSKPARVIKPWTKGLPQTYEYGFDNGD